MATKTKKTKATFNKELYERQQKNRTIIEAHKFITTMAGSKNYWDYMVKIINNVESLCGYPAISDTDYKIELLATFSDILHKTEWPEDPNEWKAIHIELSQGAMMQLRFLFDFMYISTGNETEEDWEDIESMDTTVRVKGPIKHDWNGNVPTLLELLQLGVVTFPQFCEQDGWNRGFKEYKLDETIRYIIEYNSLNLRMRQYYLMCLYFDKYRWNGEIISEMERLLINNNLLNK